MNFLCNNCNLNADIEDLRKKLNNAIVEKNDNLLDDEIISLSQFLDNLVYECIFCKKKLNNSSKLNLKDIFGTHSSFYYYGKEHLFANMYFYIIEGINNNELIYVSMQENLYVELIEFLKINDVSINHIKFRPVKELIMSNKQGDLIQLKQKISSICLEDEVKKYNGIRWIGQPTYAIETTSQDDFLNWEINLNKALSNTNVSLICIYDAYDYMHEGKVINEEVINKSLDTHSYLLKNLILEEIS